MLNTIKTNDIMKTFEEKQRNFINYLIVVTKEVVSVAEIYNDGVFSRKNVSSFIDNKWFGVSFINGKTIIRNGTDCKEKVNELLIKHGINDSERED